VAFNPIGSFAYVANSESNTVSVINTANHTVIGQPILVGAYPISVAFSPDGFFAYVANYVSNTVSVI